MTNVSFMIVNEREALSRAMYWELKRRAPPGIPVYQQAPFQTDVWDVLDGSKDDFLVYDRCGLLTFHIVLPYSFLHYPYVEAAVRATYNKNICNCSADSNLSGNRTRITLAGTVQTPTASPTSPPTHADNPEVKSRTESTAPHSHHHDHPPNHHHHQNVQPSQPNPNHHPHPSPHQDPDSRV